MFVISTIQLHIDSLNITVHIKITIPKTSIPNHNPKHRQTIQCPNHNQKHKQTNPCSNENTKRKFNYLNWQIKLNTWNLIFCFGRVITFCLPSYLARVKSKYRTEKYMNIFDINNIQDYFRILTAILLWWRPHSNK